MPEIAGWYYQHTSGRGRHAARAHFFDGRRSACNGVAFDEAMLHDMHNDAPTCGRCASKLTSSKVRALASDLLDSMERGDW